MSPRRRFSHLEGDAPPSPAPAREPSAPSRFHTLEGATAVAPAEPSTEAAARARFAPDAAAPARICPMCSASAPPDATRCPHCDFQLEDGGRVHESFWSTTAPPAPSRPRAEASAPANAAAPDWQNIWARARTTHARRSESSPSLLSVLAPFSLRRRRNPLLTVAIVLLTLAVRHMLHGCDGSGGLSR